MAETKIEWTDATWNPTTGCDRVSPGCDHCYALTMAKRLKGMGSAKYQGDGDPTTSGPGFLATEHADTLAAPLHWRKPRKVFVNSMSDTFHDRISNGFLADMFAIMAITPQHTYQLLTKRHARMHAVVNRPEFWTQVGRQARHFGYHYENAANYLRGGQNIYDTNEWKQRRHLDNVWLGTSVENQQWANIRIPALLDTPAAVRFLSCEPLLGPVDLAKWIGCGDPLHRHHGPCSAYREIESLDWVIVGGESGHRARPMHPAWARELRDQAVRAGIPFLFKQWGEWGPAPWVVRVCDPAVGWQGTADELAAAQADAEARGATHAYAEWAHEYDHDLYEPPHKPWSIERVEPLDDRQAPMRRWGKAAAGRELDGREWNEFPAVTS
ncbi:hypothetical protein ALI144C_44955 [Actinosynnema sp. ALI-1.44]|uniref:phage Gp37/Gp68 family protein n=1 Tax=Actinosynnema sp. ALI-1.44 TaxID=1933779 RepID=UPI00097BEE27|nr:phage Gp37/Gp68 family protein [Actinosynnema sp. ALI-1.44]ONI73103.1 hypothetical protein ALI144C_44955 [Actinosynnema sp. ALI-1.44]